MLFVQNKCCFITNRQLVFIDVTDILVLSAKLLKVS